MNHNLKIFLLIFLLFFAFGFSVLAQEVPAEVTETVNLDENIQAEDLEISEPKVLPDSPFYFLKNWGRAIRFFFAFNPITKIGLKSRFADEKLIELKKMIEEKKDPEAIKAAIESYRAEIEEVRQASEEIREKAEENSRIESFLDKWTRHQILHQRLLQRLETQVPPEAFEKIKEARERHLERFRDVMLKLEDRKEKIEEKLEKHLEEIKGSKYKDFKNLEFLEDLKEKMPPEIKERIEGHREEILEKLYEKLEKMPPEDQEQFKAYLEKISGSKLRHLYIISQLEGEELSAKLKEILEKAKEKKIGEIELPEITAEEAREQFLKAEAEIAKAEEASKTIDPEIYKGKAALELLKIAKELLDRAREAFGEGKYGRAYGLATAAYHLTLNVERIARKIEKWKEHPEEMREKFEELYPGIPLPPDIVKCKLISPPRCPKAMIKIERTAEGCPVFKCEEIVEKPSVPPEEREERVFCHMLWDPVCGVDGKTYPNDCVAEKIAKVEIAHKGVCEEMKRPFELRP